MFELDNVVVLETVEQISLLPEQVNTLFAQGFPFDDLESNQLVLALVKCLIHSAECSMT